MKLLNALQLLAFLAVVTVFPAHAGIFRAYLSIGGNDANPCTLPQPCRLLPAAIAAANDGGEVWMLDSANFNTGPVLIDKGLKILAIPGAVGSVVGNGGDALVINAPGKDVTLRNLVILNLAGGMNGVNVQEVAAIHIEKSTIHEFTDANGACVRVAGTAQVRAYIDDSFLRSCRTGVRAVFLSALAGTPSIMLDNTRIERTRSSADVDGIWLQGCVRLYMRNGSISRTGAGILVDSLVPECFTIVQLTQTQIASATHGVSIDATTANARLDVSLDSSQILTADRALHLSNSGANAYIGVSLDNSRLSYCTTCIEVTNDAAGSNVDLNFSRSQIVFLDSNAIDLTSNAGFVGLRMRESSAAAGGTILKTRGTAGGIGVSLVRNVLGGGVTLIDHGAGSVILDGNHMTGVVNTFVNNGSGDITSLGNNVLRNFGNNTPGLVYITPTPISPM